MTFGFASRLVSPLPYWDILENLMIPFSSSSFFSVILFCFVFIFPPYCVLFFTVPPDFRPGSLEGTHREGEISGSFRMKRP
jgi:hypothetical protein